MTLLLTIMSQLLTTNDRCYRLLYSIRKSLRHLEGPEMSLEQNDGNSELKNQAIASSNNPRSTADRLPASNAINVQQNPSEVGIAIVRINVNLSAIATGVAAILSQAITLPTTTRFVAAILAGTLAVLTAYAALWALAYIGSNKLTTLGLEEILTVVFNPKDNFGPYWITCVALCIWFLLALSISIFALAKT